MNRAKRLTGFVKRPSRAKVGFRLVMGSWQIPHWIGSDQLLSRRASVSRDRTRLVAPGSRESGTGALVAVRGRRVALSLPAALHRRRALVPRTITRPKQNNKKFVTLAPRLSSAAPRPTPIQSRASISASLKSGSLAAETPT